MKFALFNVFWYHLNKGAVDNGLGEKRFCGAWPLSGFWRVHSGGYKNRVLGH